jgi:hypothetical protein
MAAIGLNEIAIFKRKREGAAKSARNAGILRYPKTPLENLCARTTTLGSLQRDASQETPSK